MPQPTFRDVRPVDPIITAMAMTYAQNSDNYIATKVFPPMMQNEPTGQYVVFPKNDWLRDQMQRRAPGTRSEITGFGTSWQKFGVDVFALKEVLDEQTNKASQIANLERRKIAHLVQQYLTRLETQWATDFMTTGIWSQDLTPTQWSDKTNGDPRSDINSGRSSILGTTGQEPNTLLLGYQTYIALKSHPQILQQFQYTSPSSITQEMLKNFFELDNLFVAKSIKATNREGETAAYSFILGKVAWLGYVDPNAAADDAETPTAGRLVFWDDVTDGLPDTLAGVTTWWDPETRSDKYEIQAAWDDVLTAPDLGLFYPSIVA